MYSRVWITEFNDDEVLTAMKVDFMSDKAIIYLKSMLGNFLFCFYSVPWHNDGSLKSDKVWLSKGQESWISLKMNNSF